MRYFWRLLNCFREDYVELEGTDESLWRAAMCHAPFSYQWLGRSLAINELELRLGDSPQWQAVRVLIQANDRIWPFVFNENTLAMRKGYVVVRQGMPIGGVLTHVS